MEAVIGSIGLFTTVVLIWGGYILTRHKERMTLIEKGTGAEDIKSLYARQRWSLSPLTNLKWGMLLIGVGIAILLSMWLREAYMVGEGVFPGMIAILGGLALVVFYAFARKKA
jgi:hypothetical protein